MKLSRALILAMVVVGCQDNPLSPTNGGSNATRIGVTLDSYDYRVFHLGDTVTLRAFRLDTRGLPIAPDTVRFYWTSTDTTVFTVDTAGLVTFVGLGSTDVVARLRDTGAVVQPSPSDSARGTLPLRATYTVIDSGPIASAALADDFQCIVRAGGQALCRGYNGLGELGNGTTDSSATWVPVSGGLSLTSISAGLYHACALTADKRAFCWGRGHHGQLGNVSTVPGIISTPVEVSGGHLWSSLDAGGHGATCAINAADSVPYCFGHNDVGQVGREPIVAGDSVVAPIAGSHQMLAILTEHFYTCGLEVDGSVYCSGLWGAPTNTVQTTPALGTGTPTRIGGTATLAHIAIGSSHGCGLTAAGAAYCWGENSFGQAGTGEYSSSGTMRAVVGAPAFRSIHAPNIASCGITQAGDGWCWGSNGSFALGRTDTHMNSPAPIPLRLDTKLKWISSGDEQWQHACAITEAGALICWGGGY